MTLWLDIVARCPQPGAQSYLMQPFGKRHGSHFFSFLRFCLRGHLSSDQNLGYLLYVGDQ